ncbi:MAG: tetratricopeptide repeat protein [Pirellulales bacterium]
MLPFERSRFSFPVRVLAAGVIATGLGWGAANVARAQITTQVLIGDSISDPGSRYSDVDEAIKRFNNRDPLGAQQFLEAALRKNPNLPPVDLLLAKMYIMSGDAASGLASLEKSAADNPTDPEPYLILGDQANAAGQTIQADALFEKAIELTDKFQGNDKRKRNFIIRARSGRSGVAERRRDWDTAVSDLQVLLKVDPDNAAAHYRLGRALFMQKKFQEGNAEFTKAASLDKNLPSPNVAAALLYEQLGMHNEAKAAFEAAVKANREDVKTLNAYAQWLLASDDVARAEQALSAARRVAPEDLDTLVLSGVAARMSKKMKPAEDYFVAALRLSPSNAAVINQLALLLVEQPDEDKRQRAVEFARINAMLQPNSAEANITLAWVLYQVGNTRDAEAALRKGLAARNMSPDSNYLVAKILADQNRPDVAKQFLAAALENPAGSLSVLKDDAEALKKQLDSGAAPAPKQ